MDEDDFSEYLELGEENAGIIDLATNRCRHMRCVQYGGRAMLEERPACH